MVKYLAHIYNIFNLFGIFSLTLFELKLKFPLEYQNLVYVCGVMCVCQ